MIHRHPLSLSNVKDDDWPQGASLFGVAQLQNACREIKNVLRLTPTHVSSTPFPALLRQHLPKQFVDSSIFGTYNTACTFIKHMKYDKAVLPRVEVANGANAPSTAPPRTRKRTGSSTRRRVQGSRPNASSTRALPS